MKAPISKILGCILMLAFIGPAMAQEAYVWDRQLPIPADDPAWAQVRALWDIRWEDDKVIDELIGVLHGLEQKQEGRLEPCLWLGKVYYLKGLQDKGRRGESFKRAEAYAVKAHQTDAHNLSAFYILLDALSNRQDSRYVTDTYGDWIQAVAPLPTGELLPDMPRSRAWDEAIALWQARSDIDQLAKAAQLFEQMADADPENFRARMWACYACYNWAEYYTFQDAHEEQGVPLYARAVRHAEKALALNPHSVPAHYWRQLSLARKIQTANILTQAAHLKTIMDDLLFCIRENATYDSCGPVYILATMAIEGGWVCRKGMEMAGYTVEMLLSMLTVAERLYPGQTYIPYIHAVLLNKRGRAEEALPVLERLITTGPPAADDPRKVEKTEHYENGRCLHQEISEKLAAE
jgi:tetratricopeptide (TPR) repeat protein